MYEVLLFEDRKGESTIKDLLCELQQRAATDKRARVLLNKILEYVAVLERKGTRAGEKYVKHIEGDIWELRPLNNRIFFFCWIKNKMVLLHCFTKKTQKTPKREIERAKRNLDAFLEDGKWGIIK